MTFKTITGGFELTGPDRDKLNAQRAITKEVNDKFVQVGAVYLKTSGKNPVDEDWSKSRYRDTNLQSWIDEPETHGQFNVGFNLQLGWLDIDIDTEDAYFKYCIIAALDFLRVDTRFKFGRESSGTASHVLVQLGEEESANFDLLKPFEPREFRIDGKRYHVDLRSMSTAVNEKTLARSAKQTVMPGSIYTHKAKPGAYDLSVWFDKDGKPATKISHIATTTPRRVSFNELVRAVAFGTMLYVIGDQWVEGGRQGVANRLSGWLARVVKDSQAMNNHEAIAKDVFCPVDDDSIAEALIAFICDEKGDGEKHMRIRTYNDAREKLERNPDAKIPGWPAMQELLGGEKMVALRTVFMPGSDVSQLTKMAERYIYDETDNRYIDRNRFLASGIYTHEGAELERRHKGDVVRVGGKPREAFKIFESSDMRKRVGGRDLYPNLLPGAIYRITNLGTVIGDDDQDEGDALAIFNTWRGWQIQPAEKADPALLAELVGRLDRLFGLITRDNKKQIEWMKKWIAWIFQNPGIKQQIAPVIVGGQGVGKSWFGNVFLRQMMGPLWGTASPKTLEGDFNIGPFKDKMLVFIDEAKFHSETGTEDMMRLIRSVEVPGMEKFQEARTYRLFSRLVFASNRLDMNIGHVNVRDRALFYMRAYDKDFLGLNEMEFREWAETLKPWFDEYSALMERRDVREQYMRFFMEYPVSRHELESIKDSSSADHNVVLSNMGWPRRIAKYIIEDGRIHDDLDISFPFTVPELFKRVRDACQELGMRDVQGVRVMQEFEDAGVLEKVTIQSQKKLRFKYKHGTLLEVFGKVIGVALEQRFELDAEKDYGENDNDGSKRIVWKGSKLGIVAGSRF